MRLLHRALRLLSDYLMLPFFGLLGGTRDTVLGGRLCVLRTVGRKSGQRREIPLNYVPTSSGVALLAGFGRSTGWVHNLRAQPHTEVLVGARAYRAMAHEIGDRPQAIRATRGVLKNAGAMGFFYGWNPRTVPDARIGKVVDETCCFHLVFDELPPWTQRTTPVA